LIVKLRTVSGAITPVLVWQVNSPYLVTFTYEQRVLVPALILSPTV